MSVLTTRPAAQCRYDILSLGEIMLRLDPGEGRIRTARGFSSGGYRRRVSPGMTPTFPRFGVSGHAGAVQNTQWDL